MLKCWLLKDRIWFSGSFNSWENAARQSSGYGDRTILQKVLAASLAVKEGRWVAERDSFQLDAMPHNFALLTALLLAAKRKDSLSVLDFGGSLGSLYFQTRSFLSHISKKRWAVIEQPSFVEAGKKHFVSEELFFFENIAEAISGNQVDILIASGVLQYLAQPYEILTKLMEAGATYIFIDRTPFTLNATEQIRIQHVPASIYSASYPIWLMEEKKLIEWLQNRGYKLLYSHPAIDTYWQTDLKVECKTLCLVKATHSSSLLHL